MNFNQLSRLSPFIRVATRQIAGSKTINNATVRLVPIRCLASGGGSMPVKHNSEEYLRQKEIHEKEDWAKFIKISCQIGVVCGIGCIYIAFLCFRKSNYILMDFNTKRIALEDPEDLNIDND